MINKRSTNHILYPIVILLLALTVFTSINSVSDEPVGDPPVYPDGGSWGNERLGWELLDNNSVFHMWNQHNSYYFNRSNGVQFGNHYQEYWAHNVLMIGYYAGDQWNLLYRTDKLSDFNRNIENVTGDFINITLWKDLSHSGYDFRLALRYHLSINDKDLTIIPYIKNLGIAIPFQIGFGWEMRDIRIENTVENDCININDTIILLNQTLDLKYTNVSHTYSYLTCNTTSELLYNETDEINETYYWHNVTSYDTHNTTVPYPLFTLIEKDTGRFLYLKWDESLNYLVWIKSRTGQYNAPVTLFIRAGMLAVNQEKHTRMNWLDAPTYEDFGTYTEKDDNNKLTVTTNKALAADVDRDEDVYLYLDKGVDYFDALDIDFEINITSTCDDDANCGVGVSDTVGSSFSWESDALHCDGYKSGGAAYIYLRRGWAEASDSYTGSANTSYYCTMTRDWGNDGAKVEIFSDSARTVSLDNISVAGLSTARWRYIYGFVNSKLPAGNMNFDGYIQNLDLNEIPYVPIISGETPTNQTTGVNVLTSILSVSITDPDDDLVNYTIETSPDVGSQDNSSSPGENGGVKNCSVSGLGFSTTYHWYVNATDGTYWNNKTYWFTTKPLSPPTFATSAETGLSPDNVTLRGWVIDAGDGGDVYCYFLWGTEPTELTGGNISMGVQTDNFSYNLVVNHSNNIYYQVIGNNTIGWNKTSNIRYFFSPPKLSGNTRVVFLDQLHSIQTIEAQSTSTGYTEKIDFSGLTGGFPDDALKAICLASSSGAGAGCTDPVAVLNNYTYTELGDGVQLWGQWEADFEITGGLDHASLFLVPINWMQRTSRMSNWGNAKDVDLSIYGWVKQVNDSDVNGTRWHYMDVEQQVLNDGTAGSYTNVDCSGYLNVANGTVIQAVIAYVNVSGTQAFYFRADGTANGIQAKIGGDRPERYIIPTNNTGVFEYYVDDSKDTDIWIVGYLTESEKIQGDRFRDVRKSQHVTGIKDQWVHEDLELFSVPLSDFSSKVNMLVLFTVEADSVVHIHKVRKRNTTNVHMEHKHMGCGGITWLVQPENNRWIDYYMDTISNYNQIYGFIQYADNNASVQSNPSPTNGSVGESLNPTLAIDLADNEANNMSIYFWTNASGSWAQIGTTQTGYNDTYTQTTTNMDSYDTKYWWNVTVYDGTVWTNRSYHFTTAWSNTHPVGSSPSPANGSATVSLHTTYLNITISDDDGNTTSGTIETVPDIGRSSWSGQANGTRQVKIGTGTVNNNMTYNTGYTWFVNFSDETDSVAEFYTFTTVANDAPDCASESPGNNTYEVSLHTTYLNVTVTDSGETTTGSIETTPDIGSASWDATGNGTKQVLIGTGSVNSNMSYYTTYTWWVNATDSESLASVHVFMFTTVNNTVPTTDDHTPRNSSTKVSLTSNCKIWANDTEGDSLSILWMENTTGSWVNRSYYNNNVSANSTPAFTFSEFSSYSTKYYWKVAVYDGTDNISEWYSFTTEAWPNTPPTVEVRSPVNGSADIDILPTCSIYVNDTDGNTTSIAWLINQSGTWANVTFYNDNVTANTTSNYTFLNFNTRGTTYYWRVNVSDEYNETVRWFSFTIQINAPVVVTNSSTDVEETNATLHGYLNDDGDDPNGCTVWFQYGTTTGYGTNTTNQTRITGETFSRDGVSDTYYFDDYDVGSELWDNPERMVDGTPGYPPPDIYGSHTSTLYPTLHGNRSQTLNSTNYLDSSWYGGGYGWINTVEIRLNGINGGKTWVHSYINLTPIFVAGEGDNHKYILGNQWQTSWSNWYDITTDTNASSPWTWNDVENIKVNVTGYSDTDTVDCSQVEIRITYKSISINAGTLYHYRAVANNSNSTTYGSDMAFLTKPNATTNLFVDGRYSPDTFNLSWTKGDGANHTYIERNTASSWNRDEGTLVYNNTGTYYNDTGLTMDTLYYYQAWSFANWTYNPTVYRWSDSFASGSNTTNNVDPPYNGSSSYDAGSLRVNLTWTRGNNSDREIVVQNNNSYPTTPSDGWVRQNDTTTWFNESITYTSYFTVWSYNESSGLYSATGLNIPWGALGMQCRNETNPSQIIDFNIEISNSDFTTTYTQFDINGTLYLDVNDIPFGTNTLFVISNSSGFYEQRIETHDIFTSIFNNFTFYLPVKTPSDPTQDDPNVTYAELYVLRVLNIYDNPISGAKFEIKKYMDTTDSYELVYSAISNPNGFIEVKLIPNDLYAVTINKTGYLTNTTPYFPSDSIFTVDFRLEFEETEQVTETFGDICVFTGRWIDSNNTLLVSYTDKKSETIDITFSVYEIYNASTVFNESHSFTGLSVISFWVTGLNVSRTHHVRLEMNHTTLGHVVNQTVIVGPLRPVSPINETWLEKQATEGFGSFQFGYVSFFVLWVPCIIVIILFGAVGHPGLGVMGGGLWLTLMSWNMSINNQYIFALASILILIGALVIIVKHGRKLVGKDK